MGRVSLLEALELTALIAFKDPRRHGRAAARWLRRFLDEHSDVTIEEAALATTALQALGGRRHEQSLLVLRALGAPVSSSPQPRRVR